MSFPATDPGGYQFEEKVAGHRELLRLILTGTDQKIETGFRELFARFLGHVLTRFQADEGITSAMAGVPPA
jgi:hypothetical protein